MKKIRSRKNTTNLRPQNQSAAESPRKKRKKILTIGDMPVSISGVAIQSRHVCQALLDSDEYDIVSIGGGQNPENTNPFLVEEYGDRWKIYPVKAFGDENFLRGILQEEKPDALWMMTDPRFYYWLWYMENEIRSKVPIIYYHVWDNYPVPDYNVLWYMSCDTIVSISKLTDDIVKTVTSNETLFKRPETYYVPHTVEPVFSRDVDPNNLKVIEDSIFGGPKTKKMFFYNSRNAKRKMTASLVYWFRDFLDIVGEENAVLVLNTNPYDEYGANLHEVVKKRGLDKNRSVLFLQDRVPSTALAALYHLADFTICPSDAEGFGVSSLESLACGTPVISTRTGGLQDQNIMEDGTVLGASIEPASKAIIGSQEIPFIFEDRISLEGFLEAMLKCYNLTEDEYKELSEKCAEHVEKNFNMNDFREQWVEIVNDTIKNFKPNTDKIKWCEI